MAQPTSYTRQTDFSDYQDANPSDPLVGTDLDLELDSVKQTLDEILTNLAIIQRDDTKLGNNTVHKDAFDEDALNLIGGSAGWTPKGDWATSTSYSAKDMVRQDDATYVAVEDHTSGTFATDLAAGKWLALTNSQIRVASDDGSEGFLANKIEAGPGAALEEKTSGGDKTLEVSASDKHWYAVDSGAADAYVVTLDPAPTSYAAGMVVRFKTSNANTGASTINVNGIGAAGIKRKRDGGDLQSGDIVSGPVYTLVYDGTNFRLDSEQQASSSEFGSVKFPVAVSEGGTGASTAADARANLDVRKWVFDIREYGAVIDGATDDATAWQAAIDAADAAGGGIVLHPGGTSVVDSDITSADGVRIQGVYGQTSSLGSVIKLTSNASILIGGLKGADLKELRIESDSTTDPAIDFTNSSATASYCALDRLNVVGGSQCVTFHNCLEIRVTRCRFVTISGSTNAVNLDGSDGGTGDDAGIDAVEFVQCVFGSSAESSADVVDANGDVASVKFTQCVILFGAKGLQLHKTGGTTSSSPRFFYFSDGGFENCNEATVDISAGSMIKFSNFYASNDAPTSVAGDNFRLGSGGDVILSGGEIRGAARDGVRVFNGTNATITGCHIGNNGRVDTGYGVTISSAGKVVLVGNNIGAFSDGTNNQDRAVNIVSQSTPITIEGNDLGDNPNGGIANYTSAPSGSIIRNNRGWVTENWGVDSSTPDANGNITIAHGLADTPGYVAVNARGDTVVEATVQSVDSTNITVRIRNTTDNSDIAMGTRVTYWEARI